MAIRQYIGARYTPKFMGTYDPTQAYEALSVVDNGSGTSYICDQPLNPGVPLTDSKWHLYGASSGAIINLQNQIDDMKDGTVPGSLQEQINNNTSDITALTTLTNDLNGRVNNKKTYAIFLGNSYLHGVGGTDLSIYESIKKFYDGSEQIYQSGAGFATYTGHDYTFKTMLETRVAAMTSDEKAAVTDIICVYMKHFNKCE